MVTVPYLTKVVGAKKAREIWMLCRKYKADEALQMGLVNTVVPLEQLEAEVETWCEELLSKSPGCLEILKAAFDQKVDGYKEQCVISSSMYPDWFDMPEGKEGGAAFVEKRPPRFWESGCARRNAPDARGIRGAAGEGKGAGRRSDTACPVCAAGRRLYRRHRRDGRVPQAGLGPQRHGAAAEGSRRGLEDAGLRARDIDGIMPFPNLGRAGLRRSLGCENLRFAAALNLGGASPVAALRMAAMVAPVSRTTCSCPAERYSGARTRRSPRTCRVDPGAAIARDWYLPYGLSAPPQWYALMAQRHMHEPAPAPGSQRGGARCAGTHN